MGIGVVWLCFVLFLLLCMDLSVGNKRLDSIEMMKRQFRATVR